MNIRQPLVSFALVAGLAAFSAQAGAQSVTVTCTTSAARSTADVEGFDLTPGWYSSVLVSAGGANRMQSDREYADRDDDDDDFADDDVDFEFDSKRSEVLDGDTRIAKNFIVNDKLTAVLLDASGSEIARDTAKCRQR